MSRSGEYVILSAATRSRSSRTTSRPSSKGALVNWPILPNTSVDSVASRHLLFRVILLVGAVRARASVREVELDGEPAALAERRNVGQAKLFALLDGDAGAQDVDVA